jgi:hypothetical protein
MSKIADYFEQQEKERVKEQEQRDKQTVADFAKELKKTPDTLLSQLRDAGVQKNSEIDRITEADKQALLKFLQRTHGAKTSRKRITLEKATGPCETEEDRRLKAVAEQANGAEWECLEYFFGEVIGGHKIKPGFQRIVNLIIAKSFICEALPTKKLGRPKSQEIDDIGKEISQEYWDLRDKGTSYSEAAGHLADKFHKDERHVMRLVEKHKKSVGLTVEDRQRKREWAAMMRNFYGLTRRTDPVASMPDALVLPENYLSSAFTAFMQIPPVPEFTGEDFIQYLDEQIVKTVKAKGLTGIKGTTFIDSD